MLTSLGCARDADLREVKVNSSPFLNKHFETLGLVFFSQEYFNHNL